MTLAMPASSAVEIIRCRWQRRKQGTPKRPKGYPANGTGRVRPPGLELTGRARAKLRGAKHWRFLANIPICADIISWQTSAARWSR